MQEIVILGAGIAGLAAAWELRQRGIGPLVLEQGARAGGVIRTDVVDGFVIDGGPDACWCRNPPPWTCAPSCGIADRLVPTLPPRTAFVKRGQELVPLPDASLLGLPTRVWPFASSGLFSWRGKARMAAETLLPRRHLEDESIGGFMRRRFGDEAYTLLAEPLLAGIHAGDVDRLSIHALFPRLVDAERSHGSVLRSLLSGRSSSSAQSAFVSFPGGLAELVDALVAGLGLAIRYNATAVQVTGSGPYAVTLESGHVIEARALIVATPALAAAQRAATARCHACLADAPPSPTRRRRPSCLGSTRAGGPPARGRRVCRAAPGAACDHGGDLGVVEVAAPRARWPRAARAFLGGACDPAILGQGDAEIAHAAFGDLAHTLDIIGEPELTRVYRWPHATPQYHVGHLARIREIDDRVSRFPGLYLTGSGYRGTGIPDCIADARASGRSAAEFLHRRTPSKAP